jgi:glycosyltransferase involved in cell wall biosynthesis
LSNTSVIITTQNRKEFLLRAIDSVKLQTILPEELIIIDDHSTKKIDDEELKIISEGLSPVVFKYIFNEQIMGGNFSRNLGVELSKFDIIMFLDDDDYWHKSKIENQISHFNEKIGLVYTGKKFVSSTDLSKVLRLSKETVIEKSIWSGNYIGSTSGVAIKRSVFELAGKFDEKLNSLQDFDLWIRVSLITQVAWDRDFNLFYTIHEQQGAQISSNVCKHKESINYIKDKYKSQIDELSHMQKRLLLSRMEYIIARAYRKNGKFIFFKYYFRSLFLLPSLRTLVLPFYYK